jgi:hypothetical protein
MSQMFIPPEGAIQFEITTARSESVRRLIGTAIWVEPHPAELCADKMCSCRPKYRVVIESLPEFMQKHIETLLRSGKISDIPAVCACNGRIIE